MFLATLSVHCEAIVSQSYCDHDLTELVHSFEGAYVNDFMDGKIVC
jgi:hypothetical protein